MKTASDIRAQGSFDNRVLTKLRLKAKHSYLTLARAIQVFEPKCSKSLVWQWEKGAQPTFRYVAALSKVLGCDPSVFYKAGK